MKLGRNLHMLCTPEKNERHIGGSVVETDARNKEQVSVGTLNWGSANVHEEDYCCNWTQIEDEK